MTPYLSASSIACVLVPHFGLRVALLDQSQLDGQPLILNSPSGERPRVADASPEATARGIHPGMSLREALALCPEAIAITPDPAHQTRVWEQQLSHLDGLSPRVEAAALGTAYLDLRGSARSLGSPAIAAEQILNAISPALRPRIGIAPGKFAALAAARSARPGGSRIVTAAELATFLAALPADWLPLPPEQLTLLRRLGLSTMGALTALSPAAVAARLGPAGRRAWLLAGGRSDRDDTTVRPRPRTTTVTVALDLPHPTADRAILLHYLDFLVERAFQDEALGSRAVRRATLGVTFDNGGSWERSIALKGATGKDRLLTAFRLRLGQIELPGVVAVLRLELTGVTREASRQERLPGLLPRQSAPLTEAIQVLTTRYGSSPLYRIVGVEPWSRIPERRYALAPYAP